MTVKGPLDTLLSHVLLVAYDFGKSGIEEKSHSSALGRAFTPYFAVFGSRQRPFPAISAMVRILLLML